MTDKELKMLLKKIDASHNRLKKISKKGGYLSGAAKKPVGRPRKSGGYLSGGEHMEPVRKRGRPKKMGGDSSYGFAGAARRGGYLSGGDSSYGFAGAARRGGYLSGGDSSYGFMGCGRRRHMPMHHMPMHRRRGGAFLGTDADFVGDTVRQDPLYGGGYYSEYPVDEPVDKYLPYMKNSEIIIPRIGSGKRRRKMK